MRDECGVIIVRNQDGDILLNFGELKQTSLQRMSAWHHCNPSPAMRKSLTSRKYVKADNKGEGSNSQHSQVSNDSRHWGKFGKSWNLGFPVPGVLDCTAHERAGMTTPDQWEARVTGLLTPDLGDCSEPEPEERREDVIRNPVCNLQHLARHEAVRGEHCAECLLLRRPRIYVMKL